MSEGRTRPYRRQYLRGRRKSVRGERKGSEGRAVGRERGRSGASFREYR